MCFNAMARRGKDGEGMGGLASPPSPTIGVLTSEGAVLDEVAEVAAAAAVVEVCLK